MTHDVMPDDESKEIVRLWIAESQRRYAEILSGKAITYSAEEVFGSLRARRAR